MLKLLGVLLVLCVGIFSACGTLHTEHQKKAQAEAWIRLLSFVRTRIDCFMLPLDQILAAMDRDVLAVIGCFADAPTLADLRTAAANTLDEPCRAILTEWLEETESIHWEAQVKHCDVYLERLRERHDSLSTALPIRIRLCITLYLCLSLGTAILLW